MKNNIKKASLKFLEDLLHFQHFMQIFVFAQKSVIITTFSCEELFNFFSDCTHSFICRAHWPSQTGFSLINYIVIKYTKQCGYKIQSI